MFGGLNLANATAGGPMSYGMFGGGNAAPAASGGLLGQLSQPQQINRPMVMPSGGPNVQQTKPMFGSVGFGQPIPFNKQPTLPSGGPNMPKPLPNAPIEVSPAEPFKPILAEVAGYVNGGDNPSPNSPPPPVADLFNRPLPLPTFGGGMAPAVPQPIDFGLGSQQMSFGNPLGGMNNWFSNFIAPRPPAPASMMPMKGMFGVR